MRRNPKTKDEMGVAIEELPLFEKKGVAICDKDGNVISDSETITFKGSKYHIEENWTAVCEIDNVKPLAFVSQKYNLVQFKQVFKPIIDNIDDDMSGQLLYNEGMAVMDVFPDNDDYKTNGTKFGITIINSVNLTSSVVIRFSVLHNNRLVTIPKNVAGFKKTHMSRDLLDITKNYAHSIVKVKDTWKTIVEKFPDYEIDKDHLNEIIESIGLGDLIAKAIRHDFIWKTGNKQKYNLWHFFNFCIDYTAKKSYKSDLHCRQNSDKIVEKVLQYSLMLQL